MDLDEMLTSPSVQPHLGHPSTGADGAHLPELTETMAETITDMVSAILQAQAQRHGVDLS
jgi:hypothetical protein